MDFQESKDISIGKVPKEWKVERLGNDKVCEITMGQSPSSLTYNAAGDGLPFLQGNKEFGPFHPSPTVFCNRPIKIAEKNDVLISVRAPVGELNISQARVCIGRGLALIRCNPNKVSHLFLFYYLKSKAQELENISAGSTFKAIRKDDIERLLVPLPPIGEQRKIAEILSTVDQAIEKVGEAIEKTQRLKKGLMQQLLTKGIGYKEFKKTDSGMISKTWELKKLEEISVDFVSGGTPSTSKDEYWNGDIPWMTSAFITEREVKTGQRFITNEGLKKSATKIVPKNNLLVATRVGIGKAAVNRIDIAISQDLTGIIIDNNKAIPDFIYWHIVNSGKRLKSMAQGSTIKGILREDLRKISIPLPPLPEQQKIAEILSSVDKRIEALRKRKERLEKVKRGLMEDLLTGKKRVKLED